MPGWLKSELSSLATAPLVAVMLLVVLLDMVRDLGFFLEVFFLKRTNRAGRGKVPGKSMEDRMLGGGASS